MTWLRDVWARSRALLRIELDRIAHTRTAWVLAAAMVGVGLLVALGTTNQAIAEGGDAGAGGGGASSAGLGGVAGLRVFVILIGVLAVTSEYHHGDVVWRFLAEPSRALFVAAKAGACAVIGALLGLVTVQAAAVLSIIQHGHGGLSLTSARAAHAVAGSVVVAAFAGVLGVGIGAAVRNQTVALVATLVATMVVEPVIASLVPAVARFLPGSAAAAAAGDPAHLAWLAGLGLSAVYAAAAVLIGGFLCARADV